MQTQEEIVSIMRAEEAGPFTSDELRKHNLHFHITAEICNLSGQNVVTPLG